MNTPPDTTLPRILLVDDHGWIHDLFRRILASPSPRTSSPTGLGGTPAAPHYHIDSAFGGHEAVELVRRSHEERYPFDLVFTDIKLPLGPDGFDVIDRCQDIDPITEFVICTGSWHGDDEQRLEAVDPDRQIPVLHKPFRNADVHRLAHELTSRARLARSALPVHAPDASVAG